VIVLSAFVFAAAVWAGFLAAKWFHLLERWTDQIGLAEVGSPSREARAQSGRSGPAAVRVGEASVFDQETEA
jgi:hypothetical protein